MVSYGTYLALKLFKKVLILRDFGRCRKFESMILKEIYYMRTYWGYIKLVFSEKNLKKGRFSDMVIKPYHCLQCLTSS